MPRVVRGDAGAARSVKAVGELNVRLAILPDGRPVCGGRVELLSLADEVLSGEHRLRLGGGWWDRLRRRFGQRTRDAVL